MRLIDADQLKASIEKKDRYNLGGENRIIVCGMLDDAPTIEAEPVKHGEWVDVKFSEGVFKDNDDSDDIGISITSAKCSLCHRYSDMLQQYSPKMPAYCSHCGAKMDGGEKK
jgi:hypothetical protein